MGGLIDKPHHQKLHDWWAEDFIFWKAQHAFFVAIAQKHPGITAWHEIISGLNKLVIIEQRRYKRVYGESFKLTNMDSQYFMNAINQSNYLFNEWEYKFFQSVIDQEWALSKKQKKCLYKIYMRLEK